MSDSQTLSVYYIRSEIPFKLVRHVRIHSALVQTARVPGLGKIVGIQLGMCVKYVNFELAAMCALMTMVRYISV